MSEPLFKAINYTLSVWAGLSVFTEDGRVEIDNNPVEKAIRPTAVSKKNCLFIGDTEAGERNAIVFTVIEACRSSSLDPLEYLRDFTRMPAMAEKDYASLAPEGWAKSRTPAKPTSKPSAAANDSNQQGRCT